MLLAAVQVGTCTAIPVSAADDGVIKIEAEHYTEASNAPEIGQGEFSNGEEARWYFTVPQEDKDYTLGYTFDVPATGKYEVRGVLNERSAGHTTDWYVYMNDSSNAASTYTKLADVTCSTHSNVMKMYSMGKFKLKKGSNTLYVQANKSDLSTVANSMVFLADYFEIIPTASEDEPFKLEKCEFDGSPRGVFEKGDEVKLKFTYSTYSKESLSYRFEIKDVYERDVTKGSFTVQKGKDEATLNLGKFNIGWYRIFLYEGDMKTALNDDIYFSVTQPLSARADFDETSFAADIGYAGDADYVRAWSLAGFDYVRGRGAAHRQTGDPTIKRLVDEAGIKEISDHDWAAATGGLSVLNNFKFDLYENGYKVWNAVPAANGYYAEAQEVLNEVDHGIGGMDTTADLWTAYFKAAAIGMYDAQPDVIKVFGGIAAYDNNIIRLIMQNGMLDYSDVYNYHAHSEYDLRPKKARMLANAYSEDEQIPMWGTEMGWPQRFADGEDHLTSAQLLNDARGPAVTAIQQFANGSTKNFWFLATPHTENNQNFACFSEEGLALPSYSAVSTLSYVLGEGKIKGELYGIPEDATGYLFDDGLGNDVAVIWSDNAGYVEFVADKVTYVDMVGYTEEKYDEDGDGKISIYITPQPCYVKFNGRASENDYYPMHYSENKEVKTFEANDRIILQPIWPCDDYVVARDVGYGYQKGEEVEVTLNVYNLNDCQMSGTLKIDAEDIVSFDQTEIPVELEPWEKKEIVLNVKVSDTASQGMNGFVKFYGETSDGEEISRAVSRIQISNVNRTVDLEDVTLFENLDDESNWYKNFSSGGKLTFNGNSEEGTATFVGESIIWEFPWYTITEPSALSESSGICFEVKSNNGTRPVIGSFIHMKDGAQWYCGLGMSYQIDADWHQVVIPWSTYTLYSSPLGDFDVREFDFNEINGISVGNSGTSTPDYTVRNFGYFYSDNPADKFSHTDDPIFSGVENGQKFKQGDQIVISAKMPERDYVSFKVLNRNDRIEDFTVEGNTITVDFTGYEKGSYRLYVSGKTDMDEAVVGTIDFYIE